MRLISSSALRHIGTPVTLIALVLAGAPVAAEQVDPSATSPNVEYTLVTGFSEGKRVFIGVGRNIGGVVNPELRAKAGDIVRLIIINGEGAEHEFAIADLYTKTPGFAGEGAAEVVSFRVSESGTYRYACTNHEHRIAGMEGLIRVSEREPRVGR